MVNISKIFKTTKKRKKEPKSTKEFYFDEAFEKNNNPEADIYKQFNFIYCCAYCRAHLGIHSDLISRSFQGSLGRAYLFNRVVNTGKKVPEERLLLTGMHAVADIYCYCCKHTLGWKYEKAFDKSQKYKEGKYIIEQAHMIRENVWSRDIQFDFSRTPPGSLPVSHQSTPTSSCQTTPDSC